MNIQTGKHPTNKSTRHLFIPIQNTVIDHFIIIYHLFTYYVVLKNPKLSESFIWGALRALLFYYR